MWDGYFARLDLFEASCPLIYHISDQACCTDKPDEGVLSFLCRRNLLTIFFFFLSTLKQKCCGFGTLIKSLFLVHAEERRGSADLSVPLAPESPEKCMTLFNFHLHLKWEGFCGMPPDRSTDLPMCYSRLHQRGHLLNLALLLFV